MNSSHPTRAAAARCVSPSPSQPPRLRLPPAVRSAQILDAALALFSEHGYAATRMDDIARRCGLSKGGLYAHFVGKEEIFEALVARALVAPAPNPPSQAPPLSAEQLVDWLLEQVYARFGQPALRATLRLLVAEGERVPGLVAEWHARVIQPYLDALGRLLAQGRDGARPSLLAREPWLALAPAVHGLLMQLLLPAGLALPPERVRQAHRDLLLGLLAAGPDGGATRARPAMKAAGRAVA